MSDLRGKTRRIWAFFLAFCLIASSGTGQAFRYFSEREGAPVSTVQGIVRDHHGFMWFATIEGLYRYDSRTFKAYMPKRGGAGSIASNLVQNVICDSHGDIWAATWGGLSRYEPRTDSFTTFRNDSSNANSLSSNTVFSILEDSRQGYWVGTSRGVNYLRIVDKKTKVSRFALDRPKTRANMVRCLAEGKDGLLWLGTYDGLVCMRKDGTGKKVFKMSSEGSYPSVNEFIAIYPDRKGSIWIGSNRAGLIRFDIATERFFIMEHFRRPGEELPIVSAIVPGEKGKLWIATWSGLACYDTESQHADWFFNQPNSPYSLPDNLLYALYRDNQGGIWTGSYYLGITYMHPASSNFASLRSSAERLPTKAFEAGWLGVSRRGDLWGIADDRSRITIYDNQTGTRTVIGLRLPFAITYNAFFLDNNFLWCGGNSLLSRYDLRTHERLDFPIGDSRQRPSSVGLVADLYEDSKGRLWVGGVFGLMLFDKQKKQFDENLHGARAEFGKFSSRYINCIAEDSKGNLWFGGRGEVFLLGAGASRVERILVDVSEAVRTSAHVWRIQEDKAGRIWFAMATYGLQTYDAKLRRIVLSPDSPGKVLDLQTDKNGYLWINGGSTLVRYHPGAHTVQRYDAQDGLPNSAVLRTGTSIRDRDGTLYFGTNKGAFSFDPQKIVLYKYSSPIAITSVLLFNKEVTDADKTGILSRSKDRFENLVFRHDQNVFTLEFALLSYVRSDRHQYAYKLEGFDKQWNYVAHPSATYTNLPAGKYTFLVKAANGDGFWSQHPLRTAIVILPPWWETWYAYVAYLLVLAGLVYGITRFFWLRTSFRKENDLYQAKIDFFTNVSHEIRTHLTLISGPLEKAFRSGRMDSNVRKYLDTAKGNSDRLMNLVEELLDFRKIQNGNVKLRVTEQDITREMSLILASFEHAAAEKQISLRLDCPPNPVMVWLDTSQMQKVYYNLLSNAIKYTPDGGHVHVTVREEADHATVKVADNGRGIAPEHLSSLFTNFFQVYDRGVSNTGYGIGLALTKGIVDRHRGKLVVTSRKASDSQAGETIFTLTLRKGHAHLMDCDFIGEGSVSSSAAIGPKSDALTMQNDQAGKPHTLLLIEDNEELRAFERETLRGQYQILEADNGEDGLRIAREMLPDLIVCDVMLPGLNGLDVCRKLKSDIVTSHIPIIQLSARATASQVLEGLLTGADDYLIKPFDLNVFEAKIRNLIHAKEVLKHWYSQSVLMDPDPVFVRNMDSEFVIRLKNLVLEHISDPDFGVKDLAFHIGTSVAVLYRKLRDLTGMTVNDFLKKIRMARAMQLLESGQYHVGEVATIVGYESSKYFGKEFKKVYGKTPNEIRRRPGAEESESAEGL